MSHIQLQQLNFSNMFSYGADNVINFNRNRITQLTAVNGSGKSSIAIILQELLYNKNIKSIKKGDILNRYIKDKNWNGSIDLLVDNIPYRVSVVRSGASTKVQLLENGVDISEHKVLDTYKKIQDIIGLDFEIFTQITYQSSVDLLDFLKATDTNRKKFLINLFNLEKYIAIGDKIKLRSSEIDKDIVKLQGELKSIEDFLNSTSIPEYIFERDVTSLDTSLAVRISQIDNELQNINDTCKRIDKNNMYIQERNRIKFDLNLIEPAPFAYMNEYQTLKLDLVMVNNEIARINRELSSVKINDKCSTCGQTIDNSHLLKIQNDLHHQLAINTSSYNGGLASARAWSTELEATQAASKAYKLNQDAIHRFEQLTQLIDKAIPNVYPDHKALTDEKQILKNKLDSQTQQLKEVTDYNKRVSAHNAKVDALKEQKSDFTIRQTAIKADILDKSAQSNALSILKKAFSTSGIVAFKLENLTKELETTINYYLSVLSDGQFQIEFSLDKEKLNINVINNGISAPIETMSGGEFSRIQTSILLAIRILLSKLGGSSINLLFLDEITGVLDSEGKEKLIEVLQAEEELNVFLISHDFTHPLIDKVSIIKENNISCIQS
jgi:DNA repair exonuclease SbcCD ATPase subunit